MAHSRNLGEETLKGMLQKAKSGLYSTNAPAGDRNLEGPDGRRIIVPKQRCSRRLRVAVLMKWPFAIAGKLPTNS
jgi:hypothetical protein